MTIEITEFANVSISVSPTGVSGGNFGILGFLTTSADAVNIPISVAERARTYRSLATVAVDWPVTSEVYKAATAFYAQTPTPTDFTVLMMYSTAQRAALLGGESATLAELTSASWNGDGVIVMEVDGDPISVTNLDVSAATTLAGVAAIVQTALQTDLAGILVTWTGYSFQVQSPTTGVLSTITAATGDAAEALGFLSHQSKVSNGIAAETPVAALSANLAKGVEWVGTVLHKSLRDETGNVVVGTNTLEIAQWCEAAKRIFLNTTNDLTTLSSAITTDVASQLKAASLRYSLTTFSKNAAQYPSAAVFGRAASVNFSAANTTLTLNLKQLSTITAEDLTPAEFDALRSKHASAVIRIGKSVNAYTDSRMASGSWLDTTHGLMWLENRAETDLFNLLYLTNTKIPFTQTGINTVVGIVERSCQAAVRNGLCGPGYLSDGTYLPEGFRVDSVPLADVPSGDISNRIYRGITFVMKGAGALHEVEVTGTFTD